MQEIGISTVVISSSHHQQGCEEDESVNRIDDLICSKKRQKLDAPQVVEQPVSVEATENSILEWLKNFQDGVSFISSF